MEPQTEIPSIELVDISKSYADGPSRLQILKGLSFQVRRGTLFGLSGRSGVGKSTVLNLIAGLDRVTSGGILCDGQRISDFEEREYEDLRRNHLGFVFQKAHLIPELTALENVTLSLHAQTQKTKRDIAKDVLGQLGLLDRINHFPAQLSGGQQQRVAIARAIAGKRKVLLADEPTASLDADNRAIIIKTFRNLVESEGVSIVVATHDPVLLDASDDILALE